MHRTCKVLLTILVGHVLANFGYAYVATQHYAQAFERSFFQALVIGTALYVLTRRP